MIESCQSKKNEAFDASTTPAVRISDLSFAYPGEDALLSELSLTLDAHEFALIVGETGSGKSTLLRLLKNELAPRGTQSGLIQIFGVPHQNISTLESAMNIGYISQNTESQIVCDTVWHELAFGCENLNLSQDLMHRRVAELAVFFGIETWMHKKTSDLSGGQKQILVLASVLAMQPRILLLDEPTSQLDPIAEKNFAHMLFRINRELGVSILLATHEPEVLAPYATQVMKLEDGKIEQPETPNTYLYAACDHPQTIEADKPFVAAKTPCMESLGRGSLNRQKYGAQQAIKMKAITFRYDKESLAVFQDLNLNVAQASIHAIVGGNGAGKTSLLMLVAGMLKAQRGKLVNELAASQAYLPQDPKTLFVCDTVVEELLEWSLVKNKTEESTSMLECIGLDHAAKRHPYDLSGGEQQKLALAKLLLTKPQLLLLDEPSKGLDAHAKCELAHILCMLQKQGVTCVMASHDLSFVSQVADYTSMLFDGEVSSTEPTNEFFKKNLFYRPSVDGFIRLWQEEDVCWRGF